MKKVFLLLALLLAFTSIGLGQGSGPITVKEVDESPVCNKCRTFIFPNGSLTVSGNKVTVASGGGGGTGDVIGPASATDNAVVRFNTTTGKLVQNSVVLIGDTGNVTGLGTLNTHTIPGGTDTFALLAASQSLLNKKLGSLTSNGLVTTSGGDGTLGVTVPGTGVLTALGVNVGSAGAFVTFNGAGGTPSSITLTNGSGLPPTTGISGWPANSAGVLTNNGSGTLSWGAGGSGITVGTTTVTSGTATRLLYETAGNVVGEISGATSDGTTVTLTSPTINTGITLNAAPLTMSGNISAAAWTTSGIRIKGTSVTLTDTSSSGTVASAYTNVLGGNTIAASSSTTFTNYYSTFMSAPAAGTNVTLTNAWALGMSGAQQVIRDGIGTTNATGIELINNTAAAAGAQQISPDVIWTGQGWKTTATAASQTVNWKAYVLPVQGTTNPLSGLVFSNQVNGGGYTDRFKFTSAGNFTSVAGSFIIQSADGGYSGIVVNSAAGVTLSGNLLVANTSAYLASSSTFGWNSGDLILRRNAAANLAFGATDAASPVAQTLSVQNVVAGTTNTAGATWTHQASLGTSQGVPGRHSFTAGALITASGTTQQTAVSRLELGATKVLTNNTNTAIVNVTDASNTAAAGTVDYAIEVFDGTDLQIESGSFTYQVTNKGGTIANNTVTFPTGFPKNVTTSGTLTATWTITAANPAVLTLNANSSLTPSTGYPRVTYTIRNLTQQAIAVQ